MGRNKGPNSSRRRCNPLVNRRSRAQRLRRANEKLINESLQDCLQKVTGIGFISTKNTEIKKPSKEYANSFHSFQDHSQKLASKDFILAGSRKILNPAKENSKLSDNLPLTTVVNSEPLTRPSVQLQLASKNFIPAESKKNQYPAKENSNLSDNLPLTTVVNSEPVTRPSVSGPSMLNQKKLLVHGICRNKSCGIANRCRARSRATRRSKAQRLRRVKEKEVLMKTCGKFIDKSFQDSSQAVIDMDSIPSKRRKILNRSERNEKYSDLSQKVTIVDSVSVIKTEILEPSEINTLIFQNYSQCATTMGHIPIVKTEIQDLPSENENFLLPNIKVEQTQISNAMDETSKIEESFAYNFNNKNSSNIETNTLGTYSKYHLLPSSEYPLIPCPPKSFKANASPKKNLNLTVHPNKIKKKPTPFSRTVCGCLEKIAIEKQSCENYLEEFKQDYTNQLCICKVSVHSLPGSMELDENLLKTFCLENPEFGKITCNMRSRKN